MADSNITKKALAAALKELMETVPFAKISVGDICGKCDMNRKSFYYHFKDKYDLMNWIYDTEFIAVAKKKSYATEWDFLEDICAYFYANKNFYRKALQIRGQNSFSDHFREFLLPVIAEYLKNTVPEKQMQEFYSNFFADAFICAIVRWILEKDCVPSETFLAMLKSCIQSTALRVAGKISEETVQM